MNAKCFILFFALILPGISVRAAEKPVQTEANVKPFVHPGMLHSREELEFIREKLAAGQEPWKTAWEGLRNSASASRDHKPRPRAEVIRGTSNNPDVGSSDLSDDSAAAYIHALQWCLTGNDAHAKKAIGILNAWSTTLKKVSGHDTKLLIGMTGVQLCNAAELLRHTHTGWLRPDQEQFERLLREVLYPPIEEFYPSANGNWDASMLQTMMAMGVFLDDRAIFDRALNYYLSGKDNGAIGNYFKESGECQETGRDQNHTQMGLDYLAATCEIAWTQGIDLYGAMDNRLLKGFEYTAKYNLGFEVPYEPYRSFEGRYHYKTISGKGRGSLRPMYERVFNHYHNRKGLEAPFTWQAVESLRTDHDGRRRGRGRGAGGALETLMFANQPAQFATDTTKSAVESSPGSANPDAPLDKVIKPDRLVTYKTVGKVNLKLHEFQPEGLNPSDHRAAIVFFFGGGWTGGDPKQFYQQARELADLGMVAFSAEYRVKSRNQTTPFECVMDAKSAVRWVRERAAELGVDPERIVASGGSAGGHIAACTGIIENSEEAGENLQISSVPNAMILFNPVVDTTEAGYGSERFSLEQQRMLSPCHHVRKGIVPTLIFHGTTDKTVPFENVERFTRIMNDAGNDCALVPFEGKGHGFFNGTNDRPKSDGVDYSLTMKDSVGFLTERGYLPDRKEIE